MGQLKENHNKKFKTELELNGFEIYSSFEVLNSKNVKYIKFVITNVTKSRNMFSNIGSGFKSIVGGNIKGLTYLTNNTRNEVITELVDIAKKDGANAIIGLRCEVTEIAQSMLDFVAYGTAVKYER